MDDMMIGFKAFNCGLTNRYGFKYETNKIYHVDGTLKFGNDGNGFHMCKNLEDTLRYYDAFNNNIDICLVLGFGNYEEFHDDYYGYYNMYVYENMYIIKILNRKEIIDYMKNTNIERMKRFISLYKLDDDEIIPFKNVDSVLDKVIDYYQYGNRDVFKLEKKHN